LGKALMRVWWYACFALERRVVLSPRMKPTDVGKGGAAGRGYWDFGCWPWVEDVVC